MQGINWCDSKPAMVKWVENLTIIARNIWGQSWQIQWGCCGEGSSHSWQSWNSVAAAASIADQPRTLLTKIHFFNRKWKLVFDHQLFIHLHFQTYVFLVFLCDNFILVWGKSWILIKLVESLKTLQFVLSFHYRIDLTCFLFRDNKVQDSFSE